MFNLFQELRRLQPEGPWALLAGPGSQSLLLSAAQLLSSPAPAPAPTGAGRPARAPVAVAILDCLGHWRGPPVGVEKVVINILIKLLLNRFLMEIVQKNSMIFRSLL